MSPSPTPTVGSNEDVMAVDEDIASRRKYASSPVISLGTVVGVVEGKDSEASSLYGSLSRS